MAKGMKKILLIVKLAGRKYFFSAIKPVSMCVSPRMKKKIKATFLRLSFVCTGMRLETFCIILY